MEGLIGLVSEEEVKDAVMAMKKKKAVGPNEVPVEVWKILGDVSIGWLKDLFNKVLIEGKMPEGWRERVLLYLYLKAKETYKNVETIEEFSMSHSMKIWEKRIRSETPI